jgi:hypothetical protein
MKLSDIIVQFPSPTENIHNRQLNDILHLIPVILGEYNTVSASVSLAFDMWCKTLTTHILKNAVFVIFE